MDSQNERITPAALKSSIDTYIKRGGTLLYAHKNVPCGRVTKYDFRYHPSGPEGLWIEAELFNDYDTDKKIIADIDSGLLKGFSVGGYGHDIKEFCSRQNCVKTIHKIDINEISVCEVPCNNLSLID